jgi:dTDP-4-dehydrorhamnose 3,5-epimerase
MIGGVLVHPLRQISDERGKIMHMLRCDDPHFEQFGEIYFSVVYPGVIKGWHLHKQMTLNYAVIIGAIKLVLYDDQAGSSTRGEIMELFVDLDNYQLVKIPPMV